MDSVQNKSSKIIGTIQVCQKVIRVRRVGCLLARVVRSCTRKCCDHPCDALQYHGVTDKKEKRRGDWISTYTGKKFYPLDPRHEEIDINDIIHALSNQCRFVGHCTSFYSIAQHSVLVSLMCPSEHALWGLLHDASEAYLVDLPSPLKKDDAFKAYVEAEHQLMNVICDVFGLSHEEPKEVKLVDKKMLVTEARDLTMSQGMGWTMNVEPYEFHIKPWTPEVARVKYLSRLHELTRKR